MQDSVKNIRGVADLAKARVGSRKPALTDRIGPAGAGKVQRPAKYPDGQDKHGTPASASHRTAKSQHYAHPEQEAHRRSLGSQPYSKR